jgi:hypothetical protein
MWYDIPIYYLHVLYWSYNYLENLVKYKDIVHQWDVWQGVKNLGKKVIAVSTVAT